MKTCYHLVLLPLAGKSTKVAVYQNLRRKFSISIRFKYHSFLYYYNRRISDGNYHSGRWYKNEPTPLSRSLIESSFLSGPELDTVSISSSTTSSGHRPVSSSIYLPMAPLNPSAPNISVSCFFLLF